MLSQKNIFESIGHNMVGLEVGEWEMSWDGDMSNDFILVEFWRPYTTQKVDIVSLNNLSGVPPF